MKKRITAGFVQRGDRIDGYTVLSVTQHGALIHVYAAKLDGTDHTFILRPGQLVTISRTI